MGELDAQDTVLGGCIGTERRGHCSTPCADAHLRTHLLFGHLSVRHHAGHLRMVRQESQEEPLHVFQTEACPAHHLLCNDADIPRIGWRHHCTIVSPLLCLRTHLHQLATACMDGWQQRAGSYCRALRQLCILPHEYLDACPAKPHHQHRDISHFGCARLAQWSHLLQHHLSGRYPAEHLCEVLVAEDSLRCRQVQELLTVYKEL